MINCYNDHEVFKPYDRKVMFPLHLSPKSQDDEDAILIYRKLPGCESVLVMAQYDDSWSAGNTEFAMRISVHYYDHKDHRGIEYYLLGELAVETDSSELLPPPCSVFTDTRKIKVRIPFPQSDDENTMKDAFRAIYANLLFLNQVALENLKECK